MLLNARGASLRLGCSLTWIRKLVANGKLPAYVYDDGGALEQHQPGQSRQGQGLYFMESDLEAYQPGASGRPMGSHDKVADNPKRRHKEFGRYARTAIAAKERDDDDGQNRVTTASP